MADKKAAPAPAPAAAPKKKKSGGFKLFFIFLLFGCAAPFILPTLILAGLGLLPAIVALIADSDSQKADATAVGAMNAAGLTPFLIDLWMKGQTIPNVFRILHDPATWLIILGSAGIGKLIVYAVPAMMTNLTLTRTEARLKTLRSNLEQLKTGWGAEVATTKPLDQVGRG